MLKSEALIQTGIRIPIDLLKRAEVVVKILKKEIEFQGLMPKRAHILRMALEEGMKVLEQRYQKKKLEIVK